MIGWLSNVSIVEEFYLIATDQNAIIYLLMCEAWLN